MNCAGHAALALIEALLAQLKEKGVISAEEVDEVLDGALDRVRSEPQRAVGARELLMRLRRQRDQ
jgi:hypothetical protein